MIPLFNTSSRHFPEGYFHEDCLFWGNGLNPSTIIARGARIEVPDLRSADNRTILDLRDQNDALLKCLTSKDALQITWSVEDDYYGALNDYDRRTDALKKAGAIRRFPEDMRRARSGFYREQLRSGLRRREVMHIYISTRGAGRARDLLKPMKAEVARGILEAEVSSLNGKLAQLRANYPLARWEFLTAQEQCQHIRRFLNPGIAGLMAEDDSVFSHPLDPSRTIRANCLRSDISVLDFENGEGNMSSGLAWQGTYHGIFVIRRIPAQTRPGMWLPVFDAVDRNCTVTQTITPLPIEGEVARLKKEIEETMKFIGDPKSEGAVGEVKQKRNRLEQLMNGITMPFSGSTIIRVWGGEEGEFKRRMAAVRAALAKLDGCEFHEVNNRQRARNIFLDTLPGNTSYVYANRGLKNRWTLYMENYNLTDWMPISSTFTGHLGKDTQCLLDSPGGGLVGIRFLANGTPQHTSVTGVNGAGKTVCIEEMLIQAEADIGYLYIQEEGMAFAPYALVRGIPSLVMRDSSQFTLNPFDTFGQPLNAGSVATISKIGMKLVGLSADGDKNSRRENLISSYASQLYSDLAEDWKMRDEERWARLTRRALLADKMRSAGDDFRDGFLSLRELERREPAQIAERLASFTESEIVAYQTDRILAGNINALVFTELKPDEYPTWGSLCSMMKSARFSHHKSGAVADELNYLVGDMERGKRFKGAIGPLIDGPTNVNLHGAGLHFDTSFLSDGPLKEIAGFLFPEMVRKHVMGLPRGMFKMMVLDELRRILLIPGAGEHVKEMLAQLRKYKTAFVGAFQGPSQIDEIDQSLTTLIFGQCKQHFLLRQNDSSEIRRIATAIGLPAAGARAVAQHPLIEHQHGATKKSYFTLFSRDGSAPTCGTVAVEAHPAVIWLASSNGDVFDRKQVALKSYPDPVDGIYAEVQRDRAAKAAKLKAA